MFSDIKIQESILSQDEIYQKIRELLIDGTIVGALTRSYGEAVRTAAFLNEKLKTPYIPLTRIDDLIDKKKMKAVFHKAGIPTPHHKLFDPAKDAKDFPFIVKPSKGHAKNGVRLIQGQADLKNYLTAFPSGENKSSI